MLRENTLIYGLLGVYGQHLVRIHGNQNGADIGLQRVKQALV